MFGRGCGCGMYTVCDVCQDSEVCKKLKQRSMDDIEAQEERTVLEEDLKPRIDLIPAEVILAIGTVLAHGAEKHGARSWEKGMAYSENYGALQRHLLKWWSGETYDDGPGGTGKSHLWNALTRLVFLAGSEIRGIGRDDRPVFKRDKETQ